MRIVREEGYYVSARSEREIARVAEQVRYIFYPYREKYLNVIDLLERKMHLAFEKFNFHG